MMPYCVDSKLKVIEQRGTLSQSNQKEGYGIVIATDPPKADADSESGGWKVGATIPADKIMSASQLTDMMTLPRNHIVNAIAFPPRK